MHVIRKKASKRDRAIQAIEDSIRRYREKVGDLAVEDYTGEITLTTVLGEGGVRNRKIGIVAACDGEKEN
ncbi:MAG: hypothetical protein SCH71_16965 [Desulfobulbaceae bacterium]|nr:hypothetical protein [Desulfobulbaceae bacterium]